MIIMSFIIQWVVVNVSATGGTIEDFKTKRRISAAAVAVVLITENKVFRGCPQIKSQNPPSLS